MTLAAAFASLAQRVSGMTGGGPFWPAQIVDQTGSIDDGGSWVPGEALIRDCTVQIDTATEAMRQGDGYTDGDVRFLILAATLSGDLNTDATITVLDGPFSGSWMVSSLERDPAAIGYAGRGRRA